MNAGLIVLIIFGLILTWGGAMIVFTERGFEWMYNSKIWSRQGSIFSDKDRRRIDKYYRGGGILFCGLTMFLGGLLAFLSQWEFLRFAILEFFTFGE
jgi:hypothetical protein